MQQKVLLVCKIYLFCIYFSLNNFNYPKKRLAIPSKLRNLPQNSRKTFAKKKLAWVVGAVYRQKQINFCSLSYSWYLKRNPAFDMTPMSAVKLSRQDRQIFSPNDKFSGMNELITAFTENSANLQPNHICLPLTDSGAFRASKGEAEK